ncbi:nitrogen fixation protein NifX [Tepidibacillus marianensis]|uniref:nitrogen fixation protein NifX n=1 Tax=Tepidibacillus marianensis TaxID=3131995 RepID=UPI0030CAE92D
MKVAFATNDEKIMNEHFGKSKLFIIYEVTSEKYVQLTNRSVINTDKSENGRIEKRVEAINDCSLVFVTEIGPAAAAQIIKMKIMPIKLEIGTKIEEQLDRLLSMLQNKPPLWLVKIMKQEENK